MGSCVDYCQFRMAVLERFEPIGVYGGDPTFIEIRDAFIKLSYQKYTTLCESQPELTSFLSGLTDIACLPKASYLECAIDSCGNEYSVYDYETCNDCDTNFIFDEEFQRLLMKFLRLSLKPNRISYQEVCNIFGWKLVYTENHILFVSDNLHEVLSVIRLIPKPFMTSVLPASYNC